jgi:4-hydroxybenzoate polyprenyltransferase
MARYTLGSNVKILLCLGRPRTCVPGTIAYALGFSYTGAEPKWTFVLGSLISFLVSFSANLHNALSDSREDSINLPGRADLIAQFGAGRLKVTLIALTAFMLAGAAVISPWFLLAAVGAAIGLHQYSFPPMRAKANPVFGLLIFAQAVGFPFVFGLATAPELPLKTFYASFIKPVLNVQLPVIWTALDDNRYAGMFVFIVVWFIAKGFVKNVPDYDGDRAAQLVTSATIFATRDYAAIAAKWITLGAYVSLITLVLLRLEAPRMALALLLWLPLVWFNMNRLCSAVMPAAANSVLKTDMTISCLFIATLLGLVSPTWYNALLVLASLAILVMSDWFGIDSRRTVDQSGVRTSRIAKTS